MATIKPYRGLRYNPEKISFISRVITPPYDVIDPETEEHLLEKDPYNFVRISMGKTPPSGRQEDEYLFISDIFNKWIREEVLIREEKPSMYAMKQSFKIGDKHYTRHGLITALLLEEPGEGSIHPHENTMKAPKTDRIKLMEACRANLSQPMLMYSDPEGQIQSDIEQACKKPDFLYSFRDDQDIAHTVWRIDAPQSLDRLSSLMNDQSAVIADGHHRYESALTFSEQHRPPEMEKGAVAEDYISAFMVSIKDRGLLSLPTHRGIISGDSSGTPEVSDALREHFSVTSFEVEDGDSIYALYNRMRGEKMSIGCITPDPALLLLEPKNTENIPSAAGCSISDLKKLPVNILHYCIFPTLLGIEPGSEAESEGVEYNCSASDIYWGVQSGRFNLGFLLPTTSPHQIHQAAQRGTRLPVKSTYFHPKVPSGIVIYPHRE